MSNSEPIRLRGIYRSPTHLPIWEVLDKAGIWQEVGIEVTSFEFCNSSATTEKALFGLHRRVARVGTHSRKLTPAGPPGTPIHAL